MSMLESVLAFDIFPPAAMIVQHSGRLKEELSPVDAGGQLSLQAYSETEHRFPKYCKAH